MVTDATAPLDTSIRVNDDFHCISDDYQGLVKVGNAGIWFLIDSGSAVTFIRKSGAEFVARQSKSAKTVWKEQISQWHGYEKVRIRTLKDRNSEGRPAVRRLEIAQLFHRNSPR